MSDSMQGFPQAGAFKRITITREETVIRKGTADVWIPDGVKFSRDDGIDDTQDLADLLEIRSAIDWEYEAHMEDYVIEAGVEEEDLPEEDQGTAVPCTRDEDLNWVVLEKGGR